MILQLSLCAFRCVFHGLGPLCELASPPPGHKSDLGAVQYPEHKLLFNVFTIDTILYDFTDVISTAIWVPDEVGCHETHRPMLILLVGILFGLNTSVT